MTLHEGTELKGQQAVFRGGARESRNASAPMMTALGLLWMVRTMYFLGRVA